MTEEEDAFNAQLDLIKSGKPPVLNPFADYINSLGTQKEIKEATSVTSLNLLSDDEVTDFKNKLEADKKAVKLIKKYIETEEDKITDESDESEGIK